MKKLTRLLSILMLIAMCLSLMTVSASAAGIVTGDSAGSSAAEAPVVINNGGKDVFSTENYYKDQEFYSEPENSVEGVIDNETPEVEADPDFDAIISEFVDTSYPNVSENMNQIRLVLKQFADGEIGESSNEMKSLIALFGEAVNPAINEIKLKFESKKTSGALKSSIVKQFKGFTVGTSNPKDLSSAISASLSSGKPIEISGTWPDSVAGFVAGNYSINLQGCKIKTEAGVAAFVISYGSTFSFSNGTIEGDGFVCQSGSRVNINNITVSVGTGNSALTVFDANVNVNGCTFTGGSDNTVDIKGNNSTVSLNANVSTSSGNAIKIEHGTLSITGGAIEGKTGIYIDDGVLNFNSDGFVVGTGTPTAIDEGIGAAIVSYKDSAIINIVKADKLQGAKNGAIVVTEEDNKRATNAPGNYYGGKIRVANAAWLDKADSAKEKLWSDYNGAVASIGNATYVTLKGALTAAQKFDINQIVKLLNDVTIDETAEVAGNITIDGDGHKITLSPSFSDKLAIEFKSGSAQIKNLNLNCNGRDVNAVQVDSGAKLEVNGLNVSSCNNTGIYAFDGEITVSQYTNTSNTTNSAGFACDNGKITVHGCKIDCQNPVSLDKHEGISIDGGSFWVDDAKKKTKMDLIDDLTVKGSVGVLNGSYYEVSRAAASISLVSGYDSSADPAYFWYFKGLGEDNAPMTFKSATAVELGQATVISEKGLTSTVSIVYGGNDSKDSATIFEVEPTSVKSLDAGSYTLRIPFADGNYCDVGLKVYAEASVICYKKDGTTKNWQDKEETIPLYDAADNKNGGLLKFSDYPVKVGITYNPADTDTIVWLDDIYFNSDKSFTLMQDDLNKLPAGLNYVVLKYDDDCIFGAKVYVKNVNASINPEKVKWSTLYGDIVYTVVPDIKSVKFDGIELEKDNQYFINKSGKLVLKANFLKNYIAHDKDGNTVSSEHTLLVETSKGNVLSNITIGEQLKNNGVNYHIYGGTATLSFVGSNPIDYSKGIWIGAKNPVQIPDDYITQTSGTTFTIKADYLNKLTYGTYTIGAYINGEYCTTTFVICTKEAATAAATGDTFNAWIWIAILVLVAIIFFVILLPKLKGKKNAEPVEDEKVPEEDTKGKQ